MTRAWAPKIKATQEAIRAAILTERTAQLAQLPAGMQGTDFVVAVATRPDVPPAKPFTVQVLPPERSTFSGEVTRGLEARLEFTLIMRCKTTDESDAATIIREMEGLILDALDADSTLGGVVAGFGDPAMELRDLIIGVGELGQELAVHYIVRA